MICDDKSFAVTILRVLAETFFQEIETCINESIQL
jgi:hypothetical protein